MMSGCGAGCGRSWESGQPRASCGFHQATAEVRLNVEGGKPSGRQTYSAEEGWVDKGDCGLEMRARATGCGPPSSAVLAERRQTAMAR